MAPLLGLLALSQFFSASPRVKPSEQALILEIAAFKFQI
jgi:hypothetical protein